MISQPGGHKGSAGYTANMHIRRILCWLLGGWIGASLFMFVVATQNFRSVDRLLASPAGLVAIEQSGLNRDPARMLLRYQVSEQNRWYFETWEQTQFALAGALLLAAMADLRGYRVGLLAGAVLVAILAAERWYLTPEIVRLGRALDFSPAAQASAERTQFWRLHGAYSTLEVAKVLLLLGMSVGLVRRGREERSAL